MAIIDNRVTEEGDVLIIKPEVPIVGLISLYNFIDTTQGESETDYFLKEFRYSLDGGIVFTDWIELSVENISSVNISKENQFVIEYRYTRVGEAEEIELQFDDILVSGDYDNPTYPVYNNTYFNDFFVVNNINVYGWALNVLEKLYNKGILPEYVERGNVQGNILIDQDFITFWNSITHYFAILVYMSRQFREIENNDKLIELFLINRGIEIRAASVEELQYLFNNWILEFRKRGTYNIISKKVDNDIIDGELLRLIGYEESEEFIFAPLRPDETGWCVGKSSPCWKGTENMINLIKGYEFSKEVKDLTNYPLLNSGNISLDDDKVLINSLSTGASAGISDDSDVNKRIIVSPNLDYEISFFVEVSSTSTPLTFSIKGFNKEGNIVNLQSIINGSNLNNFFTRKNLGNSNTTYFIRGVIWNKDKEIDINSTFYPSGVNLRSTNALKYIIPQIVLDNSQGGSYSGTMKLWNIKVRPLHTPFTRGQLGIKNIVLTYMNIENSIYDETFIQDKIQSSMINAGSFLKIKQLNN